MPAGLHRAFIGICLTYGVMVRTVTLVVLMVLLPPLAGHILGAQGPAPPIAGALRGTVEDVSGGVVSGAAVTLLDSSGTVVAEVKTDSAGVFTFEGVAAGSYEVRTTLEGFETATVPVRVTRGRRTTAPKIVLQVAGIKTEVTVAQDSSAVSVAPAANKDAVVMDAESLRGIPVFDRDIVGTLSRFLDSGSIGSGGATLVVDGMEARKVGVSPGAIAEVRINQDPYAAEFQRPGRGRIEVITKAGTDAYHGSFDFNFRDASLNARDVFAATKPPEQRRIYEGVFGGPIAGGEHTSFLVTAERRDEDLQSIVFAATPGGIVDAIVPRPTRGTELSASWNHMIGQQTVLVRFTGETQSRRNQGVGGTTLPEAGSNNTADEEQVVVGHRWILGRHTLSEFRVLFGREVASTLSLNPGVRIVVPDAFTAGGAQADQRSTEYHMQLAENVSYVAGQHLLKFGVGIPDLSRRGFDDHTNFSGTFTFASTADYTQGRPLSFLQQQGDGRIVFLQQVYSAFAQDQWSVSRTVSVGIGLRYDWQNIFADNNNVAPRASISYTPLAHTVIRAGVGWFYDRAGDGAIREVLRSRQGLLQRYLVLDPAYPEPFSSGATNAAPPPALVQLEPGLTMPYTVQWSAGLERQLRQGMTATATYVGGRGVDLFRSRDVNAPLPPDYALRPHPAFSSIREIESAGRQRTDSLQLALKAKIVKRVDVTAQYALTTARNDTSGINYQPANSYDLSGEYGRADFDQRHRRRGARTVQRRTVAQTGRRGVGWVRHALFAPDRPRRFQHRPNERASGRRRPELARGAGNRFTGPEVGEGVPLRHGRQRRSTGRRDRRLGIQRHESRQLQQSSGESELAVLWSVDFGAAAAPGAGVGKPDVLTWRSSLACCQ